MTLPPRSSISRPTTSLTLRILLQKESKSRCRNKERTHQITRLIQRYQKIFLDLPESGPEIGVFYGNRFREPLIRSQKGEKLLFWIKPDKKRILSSERRTSKRSPRRRHLFTAYLASSNLRRAATHHHKNTRHTQQAKLSIFGQGETFMYAIRRTNPIGAKNPIFFRISSRKSTLSSSKQPES